MKYASSLNRFLAALIDMLIVGRVTSVIGSMTGGNPGSSATSWANYLSIFYYIAMTSYYGATLGKMAMHMKVVDAVIGNKWTMGQVIMHELVGKFVSAIVILLGFIWILFDAKKQGWHDKIAKTVVLNV